MTWEDLSFWSSKEWQTIEERLDDLDRQGKGYNPSRENIFAALDATPYETVRVAIIGQDPYPDKRFCTGVAFSIPPAETSFPPTLINIFKEYCEDLHLPFPTSGDLSSWCRQGVLLWNAVPTCYAGRPASHRDWTAWSVLTQEIVEKLNEKEKMVFVSLGGIARLFLDNVDHLRHQVFSYSHPSPLGASKTKSPFLGSRLFSTINDKLKSNPIDWRLE